MDCSICIDIIRVKKMFRSTFLQPHIENTSKLELNMQALDGSK